MKFKIAIFLSCLSFLALSGCGVFHEDYAKKDSLGYYTMHYSSCGPRSLERALKNLGDSKTKVQISREIQDSGNRLRSAGSIFHHEAVQITTPSEIKSAARKFGYDVKELKDIEDLNKGGKVGVVLILGCLLKKEAHWICYPVYSTHQISNYFGKNTKITKIYVLTPKELKKL